jgi:hypothetical protein
VIFLVFNSALIVEGASVFTVLWDTLTHVGGINFVDIFTGNFFWIMFLSFRDGLMSDFDMTAAGINIVFIFALIVLVASFMTAGMLAKRNMKKDHTRRFTKRGMKAFLIRGLVSVAVWVAVLFGVIFWTFAPVFFLYLIVKAVANIIEVKYIYFTKTSVSELLTLKNVAEYAGVNLLFFVLTIGVITVIKAFSHLFFAMLIGIPLFVYYFEVAKFTTVEYFETLKKR